MIFDIQRFSVHDGPGIRTTVFFKGCNLRCRWCHNPESWEAFPELERYPDKCIGCGRCVAACRHGACTADGWDRTRCQRCGACAAACPSGAIRLAGREEPVEQVLATVLRDRDFYGADGGLTASGGECLLQPDFLEALLRGAKAAGITTAVDTAGCVPWARFERILDCTDLFLYDVKAVSPELHRAMTGVDNALILANLRRLTETGARLWVRVPMIPGVAAEADELRKIGEFLAATGGIERVELLNYHRLGAGKCESLGKPWPMDPAAAPLDAETLEARTAQLRALGLNALHN